VVRTDNVLDQQATTLAEAMSNKGYQTVFIGVNELFTHDRGLDRGYDVFEAHVGLSVDGVRKRVAQVPRDGRPRFLHLHLFEPHCPYWPPRSHRGLYPVEDEPRVTDAMLQGTVDCHIVPDERRLDGWFANYDAELNALDGQLERLLRDWTEARWILVGDHGEAFWEHGTIGHGTELVPEVLRVPLIVREPSGTHSVVEEPVSTREVYRLVLQEPLLTDVLSETSQTAERQCVVTVGEPSLCAVVPRSTPTLALDEERLRALEALGYTHLIPSPDLGED
jgi:arylsulfatase A-like enzyme